MWVTTDNIFISDTQPDSDGFTYVHRPCLSCLGSGINCTSCSGSGTLPPMLEKVYPVYEWAALNGLKLPFDMSVEQTNVKKLLAERITAKGQSVNSFNSSLIASLNKSNFPTKHQYRYLLPVAKRQKSVLRPFSAKVGVIISLVLTVKNIEVLSRKCSIERFSSILLETTDHQHLIAYDSYPSKYEIGESFSCNVHTIKRLWINNLSIFLVKLDSDLVVS